MCKKTQSSAQLVLFRIKDGVTVLVCDFFFKGCQGEEETGPRGVRVPGESLLGGAQTAGESTHADA